MSKKLISLLLSLLLVLGAVGVPVGAANSTQYLLTYNPNNGNLNHSKAVYVSEGLFTLPPDTTSNPQFDAPPGKKFAGWSTSTSDNSPIITQIQITGDKTVYAIWDNKTYTVAFNLNGGSYNGLSTAPSTITVTYGGRYTLPTPDPTKEGHVFDGWYTDATNGTKVTSSTPVGDPAHSVLYAHWIERCTVAFDSKGGTVVADKTYNKGAAYGTLPTPTKLGFAFDGWYISEDATERVKNTDVVDRSKTLIAKWTAEKYTVTLNPDCSDTLTGFDITSFKIGKDETYSVGSAALSQTPGRTGYTFKGWFTEQKGRGTQIAASSTDVYGKTTGQTLYAYWEAKPVDLTLDYNYPTDVTNTPPPSTVQVTYDSPFGTALASPTPGVLTDNAANPTYKYTFAGWYEEKEDTPRDDTSDHKVEEIVSKKVESTDIVRTEGPITLYARWSYEIELFTDKDDTTAYAKMPSVIGGLYDAAEAPKDPTKPGYTFAGWYYEDKESGNEIPVALNTRRRVEGKFKTLYAHWTPAQYQVTLDPNGGALVAGTSDKIGVRYQEAYPALPDPDKRKGYTFDGWYTAKDGGTKIVVDNPDSTKNTIVTKTQDHVLYAHWTPKSYTVTLSYEVPAGVADYNKPIAELNNIKIGDNLTGLPEKKDVPGFTNNETNFTFHGWYTSKGAIVSDQSDLNAEMLDVNEKVTIHARWDFDVKFYNNTSTATNPRPDTTKKFTTETTYGDELPTPTRTAYTFAGWYTSDGSKQITSETDVDKNITELYAHWTDSEYIITLSPNGGTFSASQGVKSWKYGYNATYGDNLTNKEYIPTPPAGHTFDGWYTEKEGGRKLTASDRVTEGGTIYAHWKADQFKVTLKLNYSGAADTVKTVDYGTELKKVLPAPEPERTGYAFLGWFKDESFATPANPEEKIAANTTLYAQWKEGKRVDLVVGGGKLPENTPSYIYVYDGGTFNKLPTPTWPGCIFGGWWTATTGGEQVTVVTPAGSNPPATLYARWTPKQVKVSFDYNGAPNLQREPKSYSIGSPYTGLPTYASWPGHEFMGWYTRSVGGEKIEASTLVSVPSDEVKELTIYAHWGYKVSFDPMEGTGEMDQQIAEMNQPYTLPTCTFTPPDGMRFGGWAIGTPDGTKQAGGSQYTVNRHLTLYATWTTAPIVITSSCTSGGSLMTEDGKANAVTVERGTDVTFVAAANTGYVLKELLVDGVNFNYTDVYTFRNVIEDHVIHAVFVPEGAPAYSTCGHGNSCPLSKYRDMTPGAWYHDGVHFCIDNVIMGGTGDGVFSPNSRATRAEVATTLWNYAGRPPIAGTGALPRTYKDVKPSAWYYQSVEWATQEGLLSGYGNGTFRPDNYITREELVSILWHHAGQPKARQTGLRFYDAWQVSNWAWDAMLWATEEGILSGRSFGYLVPKGTATRAEVATMLKNYLG